MGSFGRETGGRGRALGVFAAAAIASIVMAGIPAQAHVVAAAKRSKPQPGPAPTSAPVTTTLFSDGFDDLPSGSSWLDGSDHGKWNAVYNGYGVTKVVSEDSKHLAQAPLPSTRANETHANLVTTKRSFTDVDITLRMKTVRQLRTPAPNPWETAWALWNYTDDLHFYYIVLKPNGWELGKEDPAYPGAQRFLATGSTPRYPIGHWYTVRIRQVGNRIEVWVDGVKLTTFVDRERPYTSGRIGLYNEDAEVRFDNVVVTAPTS